MKTEKSILMLVSLSLLAFAVFTSYNTPPVDRSFEIDYKIEIENFKREMTNKISTDNSRMRELKIRYEIEKSESGRDEEGKLMMLEEKINEMQTALNNYDANGLEEWKILEREI